LAVKNFGIFGAYENAGASLMEGGLLLKANSAEIDALLREQARQRFEFA
jgi:hypothetical protein